MKPATIHTKSRTLIQPEIRVVTNELTNPAKRWTWLTKDVTVDEMGVASYFIDAIDFMKSKVVDKSHAATFVLVDSGIMKIREPVHQATPTIGLYPDATSAEPLDVPRPFGDPNHVWDRIFALEMAQEIVKGVAHLEPVHKAAIV